MWVGLALPHSDRQKDGKPSRFCALPVSAQGMAIASAILCRPVSCYPSEMSGNAILNDALDLNWGARMFEVQVTGDPSFAKFRSGSRCTGHAALMLSIDRSYPLFARIAHAHGRFESGPESERRVTVSFFLESRPAQRVRMQIATAPRGRAAVAASHPSADIFEELSKASAGVRRSSRQDVLRLSIFAHPPAADRELRCLGGRKRGIKVCR